MQRKNEGQDAFIMANDLSERFSFLSERISNLSGVAKPVKENLVTQLAFIQSDLERLLLKAELHGVYSVLNKSNEGLPAEKSV